jgi:DNA-3-methyladenine glycosylase
MLQGRTVLHQNGWRVLPRSFYARPTLEVLRDLIGHVLVHVETAPVGSDRHAERARRTSGVIVEAEAYIGESDAACHAAPGPTTRNAPLYGPPGFAYVYLNYGLHEMVNAVTEPPGSPAAILIRALAPLEGLDRMQRRRVRRRRRAGTVATADLCRGPGNLTVALGIDRRLNRADLTSGALRIEDHGVRDAPLTWSTRIGIRVATDRRWRCTWTDHPSLSRTSGKR